MDKFKFEMSLSVLNHLGRNLYRNFITVLGEAISNAWDADATTVEIFVDSEKKSMLIIDDGIGMTSKDFQNKFLRVGHSKRDLSKDSLLYHRPFIGRKGIGKLALLSCSDYVEIASRYKNSEIIGGTIDNSDLDEKIALGNLEVGEYSLELLSDELACYLKTKEHGTAIRFLGMKANTINSVENIKKALALYFQFAMLDKNFNMFVNGEKVGVEDLRYLTAKTQMIWNINNFENKVSQKIQLNEDGQLISVKNIQSSLKGLSGFIATVDTPKSLKVSGMEGGEVTLDLFVNGRVREKNLLKYFPTKRIVESYTYGQIHYDLLDSDKDIFTSSREGIVASDSRFQELIKELETIFRSIMDEWDKIRVSNRQKGDPEGPALTKKDRPAREMVQAILEDDFGFSCKKSTNKKKSQKIESTKSNRDLVQEWVNCDEIEAAYNAKSYATCFVAENLLRDYIKYLNLENKVNINKINNCRKDEDDAKNIAGIDYQIRQKTDGIYYSGMSELTKAIATKKEITETSGIMLHSKKFKPLRDAVAHTGLLTNEAKIDLELNFTNIKERIIKKLDEFKDADTLIGKKED